MNRLKLQPISIAILPFKNISQTQDLNYFVDGFTEDLITDLSRYSSLRVISKHSTKLIDEDKKKKEKLITALNADFLVKGSFRQTGDKVRINAQLIKTDHDEIIWSNRHDAGINDIFEILDDLVEQLVSTLQRQVDIHLLAASRKKPHTSLAAYEYWLMGMNELKKGDLDSDNAARELFQKALQLDPEYSRACAGMSLSYFNEWSCQFWERWDYSQKGAFEYAKKAVDLDEANYISMTVLGRLFIYKGDYLQAEHYLRKSLRINSNDTDNLMQVASCFIYLGYLNEAEKLYLKAIKLNPINTDWYFSFASVLYFEMGEFEKCVELGRKTDFNKVMVDMTAYIAAAYYHLDDKENMMVFWKKYLKMFRKKILRGNMLTEEEALKWVKNVNPYKAESNLYPFIQYMSDKSGYDIQIEVKTAGVKNAPENQFIQNEDAWELVYDGKRILLSDAKGLHDIHKLISLNGKEVHCMHLMGGGSISESTSYTMDDKAKAAYKDKIAELKEDIDEALEMNDHVRAGNLQDEYDQIVDHLSKSMGLGGKQRKTNDQSDKARSAVTWRIRSTIKKINESHNSFAEHLSSSVKTGTFCSYKPHSKIEWIL